MARCSGKVALVTGASSGMGAATAAQQTREGARVFTAQRGPAGNEDIRADLADPASPARVIEAVAHEAGRLDVLVNTGSIEGLGNTPRHPAYGASKAGLHGLMRAVAVEHGPDGVRCNAVAPGWIDTPLNEAFVASQPDPDAFGREIGGTHPVRRTGSVAEVAALICWLASEEAGFVTGQVWTIDGGRMGHLSLP